MILTDHTQWWQILLCLSIALILSTAVGVERQLRQKSTGMRTHTLVGLAAALFMVVSKYGFDDVADPGSVSLDPSRVAAQIVSGIGFLGAGLVFVRRNKVRGLTTAASVWLTAAIGTSAGAGLVVPAVFVTSAHFLVAYLYPVIVRSTGIASRRCHTLRVRYCDGTGALRRIILTCTEHGMLIHGFTTTRGETSTGGVLSRLAAGTDVATLQAEQVEVEIELEGTASLPDLIRSLSQLDDVTGVSLDDDSE
ncbi:MgtC/SapB family protein [Arthrobacter sp. NPDC090010]|uniref:MgtC/SapB family protein n=1 Tax=Arthrobacter sp. NPDC090010 TaxID=3363942 RepID=UPI0037F16694